MSNEKFDFYIDKKITMWVREHHTIECEGLEEAKTKMIECKKMITLTTLMKIVNLYMVRKPIWNPVIMEVNQRLNYFIVIRMNY